MNTSYNIDINSILSRVEAIVKQAGDMTVPYFTQSTSYSVEYKEDASPVTLADKQTELWIRAALKKEFPQFGLIGEEFGDDNAGTQYSWIIDPIDGTKSFISGVPLYTTLLGLVHSASREPIAGCIYAPVTKEYICAGRGLGTHYNGKRVQVARCDKLEEATCLSYDWQRAYEKATNKYNTKKGMGLFSLTQKARMVRTWADGFGYMLLARGNAHLLIDPSVHIWDLVPVYNIIIEAGGYVATWDNSPIDWLSNDIDIIASASKALLDFVQANV